MEYWDKCYMTFFGFPKVFTALSEIDDNVLSQNVRDELIDTMKEVWVELHTELGKNQTFAAGIDFRPLARFLRLDGEHFEHDEETNEIELHPSISDKYARMMVDYGGLKMFALHLIAQGPFGPLNEHRTLHHRALSQILERMGEHMPSLSDPKNPINAVLFNNNSAGIRSSTLGNPIEAVASAIYRGLH